MGLIDWTVEVELPKRARVRDVSGPGMERLGQLQLALDEADDVFAVRDRAVLALLVDLGLRRHEVAQLDVEHVDDEQWRVSVRRKGEDEREWVPLADATAEALRAWLDERRDAAGPLFFRGAGRRLVRGARLSGQGVWHSLRRRSFRAGLPPVRPHAIRHSAISHLAEQNVPLPQLQSYAGHRSATSTAVYLDAANDRRREMAEAVAGARRVAGRHAERPSRRRRPT